MTSNNSQVPEIQSSFDYSTVSSETLRNFKDFNNMFRRMDCDFFTPCDTADVVVVEVDQEKNEVRSDDVLEWRYGDIFFQIRHMANIRKIDYARSYGLELQPPLNSRCDTVAGSELQVIQDINECIINQAYKLGLPPILLGISDLDDDYDYNYEFEYDYGYDFDDADDYDSADGDDYDSGYGSDGEVSDIED